MALSVELAKAFVTVEANTRKFRDQLNRAGQGIKPASVGAKVDEASLRKFHSDLNSRVSSAGQSVGRNLGKMILAGLSAAGLTVGIMEVINRSTQSLQTRGRLGFQLGSMALARQATDEFRRITLSTGVALAEQERAFLSAARGGLAYAEAIELVSSAARITAALGENLTDITSGAVNVFQIFRDELRTIPNLMDKLATASRFSQDGLSGLLSALTLIGPTARNLGLGFDLLLAIIAELSNAGMGSTRAVSGLLDVLTKLEQLKFKTTDEFTALLDRLGSKAQAAFEAFQSGRITTLDLLKALQEAGIGSADLDAIFGGLGTRIINVLIPALSQLNSTLNNVQRSLESASGAANALGEQAGPRGFARVWNAFMFIVDTVSDLAADAVEKFGEGISELVSGPKGLPESVKRENDRMLRENLRRWEQWRADIEKINSKPLKGLGIAGLAGVGPPAAPALSGLSLQREPAGLISGLAMQREPTGMISTMAVPAAPAISGLSLQRAPAGMIAAMAIPEGPALKPIETALREAMAEMQPPPEREARLLENMAAIMRAEEVAAEEAAAFEEDLPEAVEQAVETVEELTVATEYLGDRMLALADRVIGPFALLFRKEIEESASAIKMLSGISDPLAAVFVELLMRSESFARLMERLDPLIQAVADIFGLILEPLVALLDGLLGILGLERQVEQRTASMVGGTVGAPIGFKGEAERFAAATAGELPLVGETRTVGGTDGMGKIVQWFRERFGPLIEAFEKFGEILGKVIKIALIPLEPVLGLLIIAINYVASSISWIWDNILEPIIDGLGVALRILTDIVKGVINFFIRIINGVIRLYNSIPILPDIPLIPELQGGGRVLKTGLAQVHAGELVVPAAVAERGFGGVQVGQIVLSGDDARMVEQIIMRNLRRRGVASAGLLLG